MKIRIVATGEVLDVENREYWFAFEKCGLIAYVAAEAPKRNGVAKWWIGGTTPLSEHSGLSICAECPECKVSQIFHDNVRYADKSGIVPPSTLPKAFLEHCRKREFVPKAILDRYFELSEAQDVYAAKDTISQ